MNTNTNINTNAGARVELRPADGHKSFCGLIRGALIAAMVLSIAAPGAVAGTEKITSAAGASASAGAKKSMLTEQDAPDAGRLKRKKITSGIAKPRADARPEMPADALTGAQAARACGAPEQDAPDAGTVDADDLEWLAHVVAGEAASCDDKEQMFVASVVINRVNSAHFPGTVAAVISAPGQYSCYNGGKWNTAGRTPDARAIENARYILAHGSILPPGVVYQAQFRQGAGVYAQTEHHYYCFE